MAAKPRKKDEAWVRYLGAKGIDLATAELPLFLDMRELEPLGGMQARNMMSMDERAACPPVFRDYNAFPISLSTEEFAIVRGDAWHDFEPVEKTTNRFDAYLPYELVSLDIAGGEAAHIMRLHNAGYLEHFTGQPLRPIYFGRTTTPSFTVKIGGSAIPVKNPQIDYDMMYEGPKTVVSIEAKGTHYPTCAIRQIYYPWRTLGELTHWKKPVRNLFITFDPRDDDYIIRDVRFNPKDVWESIRIERAERTSVRLLQPRTAVIDLDSEPLAALVPQADKVWRIQELPSLVAAGITHPIAWGEYYGVDKRQGDYYKDAARILGLIDAPRGKPWKLTAEGRRLLELSDAEQAKEMARRITRVPVVRDALDFLERRGAAGVDRRDLADFVKQYTTHRGTKVSGSTVMRRAQSVAAWLMFVGMQTGQITAHKGRLRFRHDTPNLDTFIQR